VLEALETARLRLEPWSERHRDEFVAMAGDPAVMRWIGAGVAWPRARAEEVFEGSLEHWRALGYGWRAALDRGTGAWLGFQALNRLGDAPVFHPEDVEIGWWLMPAAWGRGLATEGALAAREEAFARVGAPRIVGRHQPANIASGRVMEKIGMTHAADGVGREGEPVRFYVLERGRWAAIGGT
jgi:RimJ/RimL family protein N-acetyltransferase